jgi:ABC-type Zn uptake system ZnuABC Zn-binding protein ZnuA
MERGGMRLVARASVVSIAAALALVAVACGSDGGEEGDGRLRVVTTVSPITSIVEQVGGDRIALAGVVPEGVNSHTYQPAPSVARLLSDADLVVVNGLQLEEPVLRMAEANASDDAVIVQLGDRTVTPEEWVFDFSFPETEGKPNPHLWTDPILALKYAEVVEAELAELDPENADYYAANLEAFAARIELLDAAIVEAVATIPEGQRRLVTYHDSWPYFAQRYGFEVLGAVQPSDFTDPSPREVAALIDQVREAAVPAVFGSEVFPSDVLETIAAETGATFVADLRDDDLPGEVGDADHSYLGLMISNMRSMITALGGSAAAFDGFDTSAVFEGESTAEYAS